MSEQIEVDDFLSHYGIPGMKWGKRSSSKNGKTNSASNPKMSRQKKVAIAVGAGAAVAVGAAITLKVVSKNGSHSMSAIMDKPAVRRGQQQTAKKVPVGSPSKRTASSSKPKPPSPYPMTPLIATPILDEIIQKYGL